MPNRNQLAAKFLVIAVGMLLTFLLLNTYATLSNAKAQSNDKPPVVEITAPTKNSTYKWGTLVGYSVVATYNGKSTKYQELPSNEVLLETTYVPDLSHLAANPTTTTQASPDGLRDIISSNCLGCHQFKSKAMGPSFAAIAKRYPDAPSTTAILSQHIQHGSTGVWGQALMPPHPEFTEKELHDISSWIMEHAADPNVNYYVGTEGAFRMESPDSPGPKAGLMITASYTSHSTKADSQALHGADTIIIHGE